MHCPFTPFATGIQRNKIFVVNFNVGTSSHRLFPRRTTIRTSSKFEKIFPPCSLPLIKTTVIVFPIFFNISTLSFSMTDKSLPFDRTLAFILQCFSIWKVVFRPYAMGLSLLILGVPREKKTLERCQSVLTNGEVPPRTNFLVHFSLQMIFWILKSSSCFSDA